MPKRDLYERCRGCDGTRKHKHPVHLDYTRTRSANLLPGDDCPLCEDGYQQIGMTAGQLETIVADRDRLLVALDDHRLAGSAAAATALEGRTAHVAEARRKLDRPTKREAP